MNTTLPFLNLVEVNALRALTQLFFSRLARNPSASSNSHNAMLIVGLN